MRQRVIRRKSATAVIAGEIAQAMPIYIVETFARVAMAREADKEAWLCDFWQYIAKIEALRSCGRLENESNCYKR